MKHDIISDAEFEKLLNSYKRKEKLEYVVISVIVIVIFAAACSPVLLQTFFSIF
jgi:hypothetical protein